MQLTALFQAVIALQRVATQLEAAAAEVCSEYEALVTEQSKQTPVLIPKVSSLQY